MSRHAEISLDFGGAQRVFRLRIRELILVQEQFDRGPWEIAERLQGAETLIEEIVHIVAMGLVGAGMERAAAMRLVMDVIDDVPLARARLVAHAVLQAALVGVEDEPAAAQRSAWSEERNAASTMMRVGEMYGIGAIMGFGPNEIDAMTIWQFTATVEQWSKAQGGARPDAPSPEELDEALARANSLSTQRPD